MSSINDLSEELLKVNGKSDMANLLKGLFTPNEIEEFATRIEIVRMLKKGIPQHEIAKKLGIGVATVTRGSREIKQGHFKSIS